MLRKQLISKYHLLQNRMLHSAKRGYGGSSYKWADAVKNLFYHYHIETVLDYGCGEGTLEKEVFKTWVNTNRGPTRHGIFWHNYDPAIKKRAEIKLKSYDLVV